MDAFLPIFLATAIPLAAIGLWCGLYGLATLDEYDPPTYQPPPLPRVLVGEVLPGEPVRLPEPAYTPPPRPVLIVDGHLGVLELVSPPPADWPVFERLRLARAVAEVRELVPAC